MKKFRLQRGRHMLSRLKKLLLMAKLTTLLILISFMQISAKVSAQAGKLDLKVKNVSIFEVFEEIEDNSEYRFFYDNDQVDLRKKVSINTKQEQISSILKELFKGTDLTYQVKDQLILVQSKNSNVNINNTQQENTVSGTVTDASGGALPGVTVVIKETTKGTTTDTDGNYSFPNVPDNATLVFSFVGMATQEIPVSGKAVINVELVGDAIGLEEVVAVGYGVQKRSSLTGAISTVGNTIVKSKPVTTISSALQGELPGMVVTRRGGQPGREGYSLRIRDFTSLNGGNTPLILIDGIEGEIDMLNPDDIETISVLKDAAASIYGSRAAGGVILITTKSGKKGKTTIEYKGSITIKTPQDTWNQPTIRQYAEMHREAEMNEGRANPWWFPNEKYDKLINGTGVGGVDIWAQDLNAPNPRFYFYEESDIKDNLFSNSISYNHSVSLSGGSDKAKYYLSGAYNKDEGFFKIDNNISEKFNLNLNYSYQVTDWLDLEARVYVEKREIDEPYETDQALDRYPNLNPMPPTFTPSGKYYQWQGFVNPVQLIDEGGRVYNTRNVEGINFKANIKFTKDLKFISQIGIKQLYVNQKGEIPTYTSYHWDDKVNIVFNKSNRFNALNQERTYQNYTNYLNYDKNITEDHHIAVTLGTSFENDDWYEFSAYRRGLVSNEVFALSLGDAEEQYNTDRGAEWTILSYFGRFNYDYKGKYLVEANWRRDGSSKFHPDKRWGNFGGLSLGWRLSEESFIKNLNLFDNLKLRASYGELGNQAVASTYNYIQTINIGGFYPFGASSQPAGASLGALPATQATWETIATKNIGVEFAVLRNRLVGTFDVYEKINKDMLVAEAFPELLGATAPKVNSGELKINGWELSLGWKDRIGDFTYFVNGNLFDSKNLVTKKGGDDNYVQGMNNARLGYPINSYFGYEFDGIIKTQEQLTAYKQLGSINTQLDLGDVMFKDVDGNGRIDPYGDADDEGDLVYLGNTSPRYNFGGNIGGEYKNFDFSVAFQGVGKRILYNGSIRALPYEGSRSRWHKPNAMYWNSGFAVEMKDENGRVIVEARDSDMPRLTLGPTNSWNWRHSKLRAWNGAYLRFKNIILGYTIPKELTSKLKIESVRLYFNGSDLFTIHNVPGGYDPEQNNDYNVYPYSKNYIFGIQVKL